jgi:hypothetical protein
LLLEHLWQFLLLSEGSVPDVVRGSVFHVARHRIGFRIIRLFFLAIPEQTPT